MRGPTGGSIVRVRLFIQLLQDDPRTYFAILLAVVVSISVHELAHGVVAVLLGDKTPVEEGRMTLNPLVHMGPISLVVLLVSGIAWGSMPIDRTRLRGKFGEAKVAAAGPFSNLLIALATLTALGLWQRFRDAPSSELTQVARNGEFLLWVVGLVNVNLALFNMIPLPPLDGSHILANLSRSYATMLDTMVQTGTHFRVMFILFAVAGSFIFELAVKIAVAYLSWARGDVSLPIRL